jgi:hypothetical protein
MADRENSQLESETGIKPYQLPYATGIVTKINHPGDLGSAIREGRWIQVRLMMISRIKPTLILP